MASIDITGASVVISNVFALLDSQPIFGSSVTEISGVVGALGNIEIATKLRGSFVGVSSTDGFLNIATELKSSISVSSGINGYLNFRFLSVPIVAVSNIFNLNAEIVIFSKACNLL